MKRKDVIDIIYDDVRRKTAILTYTVTIVLITAIFLLLFVVTVKQSITKTVRYNEDSNIDYKVYLKDNDFYNSTFQDQSADYIAALIDYITADFSYDLSMDEKNIDYNYSYRIDAVIDVKEKGEAKSLYTHTDNLVMENSISANSNNKTTIRENLRIDYNKYNDLIKKFVSEYELNNMDSVLSIKMKVFVEGACEDIAGARTSSEISLDIPLTRTTVGIDISSNLVDSDNNILRCESKVNITLILITLIVFMMDLYIIYHLFKFLLETRSATSIYEQELKKILNNYHSYIQKINNDFVFTGFQVLYVDQFTDLLEIRETIQEPILMATAPNDKGTFFIVPSKTKILYVYSLKLSDIRKELKKARIDSGQVIRINNKKKA